MPIFALHAALSSRLRSMREECLINLKQSLLVVDEQIEQVALVSCGEISELDSVFCKLGESEETLLKLAGLL